MLDPKNVSDIFQTMLESNDRRFDALNDIVPRKETMKLISNSKNELITYTNDMDIKLNGIINEIKSDFQGNDMFRNEQLKSLQSESKKLSEKFNDIIERTSNIEQDIYAVKEISGAGFREWVTKADQNIKLLVGGYNKETNDIDDQIKKLKESISERIDNTTKKMSAVIDEQIKLRKIINEANF